MFLQTVTEVVYCLLPKFKMLKDEAADSARCMGLCLHSTCRSTMRAREYCLQMFQEIQRLSNCPNLNSLQIYVWAATFEAFLKASEAKYSFWIKSRTGENMGKFYVEQCCPEF